MSRFVKLLRKVNGVTAKNTGGLSSSTIVDLIGGGVLVIAVVVLAFRQKFLKVIRNITRKNSASYSPANCNDIELDRVVGCRMCEKFHQLLAVGRWFPPGTPVSSTIKLIASSSSFHRLDMTLAVAEALNPNKPNQTGVSVGVDRLGSSDASGRRTEPRELEGAVLARDAESVPQNMSELEFI